MRSCSNCQLTRPYNFCLDKNSPKGELFHKLGNILELKGYRVIAFNLVDMDNSDCYNPFEYIRSDNDIIKLVTNMMKNTSPKGASSSDPFWDSVTRSPVVRSWRIPDACRWVEN